MSELKKHFFDDCTGFDWRTPLVAREQRMVKDIRHVTCGQCKGRVLDAIRATDWSFLDDEMCVALTNFASYVKTED